MPNTITWFEIPAVDFERAVKFYETLYNKKLERTEMGGNPYAFLPNAGDGVGGAITKWPDFKPAENETGILIYLYAGNDLDNMIERAKKAGGKISTPKALISEQYGYYSTIIDSEGNKIALHDPQYD